MNSKAEVEHYLATLKCNTSVFRCMACAYTSKTKKLLTYHMYGHHVFEKPFACPICRKGFAIEYLLKRHMLVHTVSTKARSFQCDLCEKAYVTRAALYTHKSIYHRGAPQQCADCGKVCQNLAAHRTLVHGPPMVCELCGNQFSNLHRYKYHMDVHSGKVAERKAKRQSRPRPKIICDLCGKAVKTKEGFEVHMNMHAGYKPYACTCCEKAFFTRGNLLVHIRTHTGEKPYTCKYCSKAYSQKHSLTTHMKSFHKHELESLIDDEVDERKPKIAV